MSFDAFGKVSYTAESKAKRFVTYLEAGKVMGTKCSACKKVYFPPRMDCSDCLRDGGMTWVEMPKEWTVLTFTKAHFAPTGFEGDTPYIIAVAESGTGSKLLARLATDIDDPRLAPGMKVELSAARLEGGRVSYQFCPAGEKR